MVRRSGSAFARELFVRLLLMSMLVCGMSLGSGCGRTELIVDVGNIPAAATELRAIVRSDGKQSRDIPRFGFSEGRSTYSIGLRLHDRTSGSAQLTIGAFSKGCLISTAITSLDDLSAPPERVSINLDPPRLDDLLSDCPDELPQMLRAEAEHDSVTQRNHLVIQGWGFDPGSSAFLGDAVSQAEDLSSINPLVVKMALPDLVPPINNPLKVRIVNPDGSAATKTFTISVPVLDTSRPDLYPSSDQDPFLLMSAVAIEDLDGDGLADIILGANGENANAGRIRIYWNEGGGRFTASALANVTGNVRSVTAAKLSSTERQDLIVIAGRSQGMLSGGSFMTGSVLVFQQTQRRVFSGNPLGSQEMLGSMNMGLVPSTSVVADVTGDGFPDLAVVTNAAINPFVAKSGFGAKQELRIYDGRSLTTDLFMPLITRDLSGQGPPIGIVAGDLGVTSGGIPDLAIARMGRDAGSGAIDLYDNPGNGRFDQTQPETLLLDGRPGTITTADLDRDGRTDLAATILFTLQGGQEGYGSTVNVLFRRNPQWLKQTVVAGQAPLGLAAADLQVNGVTDLLVTNLRVGTQPALLGLLFNFGGGQFSTSAPTTIELPPASGAVLASGELNGDGHADLAIAPTGLATGANKRTGTLLTYFGL
jgi:hypothetical protein